MRGKAHGRDSGDAGDRARVITGFLLGQSGLKRTAPTGDELAGLLGQIIARLMKRLTRHGYLVEEQGMSWLAETDTGNSLDRGCT